MKFLKRMFCLGGFCPGGFWQGGFLSRGFLSGGLCPGFFVRGVFVLEPLPPTILVRSRMVSCSKTKGGFPVMAKITRILTANICRQFSFVINTAASTRCLVENFQLICYSQLVNATSQFNDSSSSRCSKWSNDRMVAVVKHFWPLVKKRLQGKITKDHTDRCWQEDVGMSSKSYSDCNCPTNNSQKFCKIFQCLKRILFYS